MAVPLMFLAAIVDERRQGEARFMTLFRATPDIIAITGWRRSWHASESRSISMWRPMATPNGKRRG